MPKNNNALFAYTHPETHSRLHTNNYMTRSKYNKTCRCEKDNIQDFTNSYAKRALAP
jgi:hypothetical protein